MWNSLNRKGIAAGLAAAGAAVLLMPVLLGFELPSIGAISSNVVGAIMIPVSYTHLTLPTNREV